MYESPIEVIVNQMYTQLAMEQEDGVYKAIQQYGINVDKEELIKALKYDRQQYNKGYRDGIKQFAERLKEFYTDEIITDDMHCSIGVIKANIDDLVKEMVSRCVEQEG